MALGEGAAERCWVSAACGRGDDESHRGHASEGCIRRMQVREVRASPPYNASDLCHVDDTSTIPSSAADPLRAPRLQMTLRAPRLQMTEAVGLIIRACPYT